MTTNPDTADTLTEDEAAEAVALAEQEAAEAGQLATALENRVRDGDESVSPTEITQARELGAFAKLRVQAAQRKAERARVAARRQALAVIRDEMNAAARGDETLIEVLGEFEAALRNLGEAVHAHNTRLAGWRRRMQALDVASVSGDAHHGRAEDLGLQWNDSGDSVAAGSTWFGRLSTAQLVSPTVHRVGLEWYLAELGAQLYGTDHSGSHLHEQARNLIGLDGELDLRAIIRKNA